MNLRKIAPINSLVEIEWLDSFTWDERQTVLPDRVIHSSRGRIFNYNDEYVFLSSEDKMINIENDNSEMNGSAILINNITKIEIMKTSKIYRPKNGEIFDAKKSR